MNTPPAERSDAAEQDYRHAMSLCVLCEEDHPLDSTSFTWRFCSERCRKHIAKLTQAARE